MPSHLFTFDNTYARELSGFYAEWQPAAVPAPALLYVNHALTDELQARLDGHDDAALAQLLAGNHLPDGANPIAQAYAGHQFGQFSPQLGDGRALLLGEVIDRDGRRRDIALKGSGRTPFSRGGDGKAVVGPMLREVIIGEALHALGIPTTRALAVVATGEPVYREAVLPGAVLTRVAASHIRVGTFEYFAARGESEQVRQLADYTIARHYPAIAIDENRYMNLLMAVMQRQAALLAQWMHIGFIHGVMNTDNMAIAGESIDFGPCAFIETYKPATVFSSIDRQGRYAYGNQPRIAQWNLARFAETLLPLLAGDEQQAIALATDALKDFPALYQTAWLQGVRAKLGMPGSRDDAADMALADAWLNLLEAGAVDYTLAWRYLADAAEGREERLRALFADQSGLDAWLVDWRSRALQPDGSAQARAAAMRLASPWIIPRNHRVEEALAAATSGDLQPFQQLLQAVRQPFTEDAALAHYAEPAPAGVTACYRTFCGT